MADRLTFTIPDGAVKIHIFMQGDNPKAEYEYKTESKSDDKNVKPQGGGSGIRKYLAEFATGSGSFADPDENGDGDGN